MWQERGKNGVKSVGIVRSMFVIDQPGVLQEALYDVTADGRARQTLERVKRPG